MAAVGEEVPGEVAEEKKPPIPIVAERQPEFVDLIKLFSQRTGATKEQAAAYIGNLFSKLNIDPERDMNEALRMASSMATILKVFPDTPAKAAAMDVGLANVLKKATGTPDAAERAVRMMETIAPYMMMTPVMREMARTMGGGSGDGGEVAAIRKEFQDFKNEFIESQKDKKLEERFAKLEAKIEGLGKPKGEDSEVVKELREMRAAFSEGKGKSEVGEKLDTLITKLTEKERASDLDEIKKAVDDLKVGVANKIAGLEAAGKGAGKGETEDQLKQAGDLFTSIGKLYEGAGAMAKSLGYEPKDEKMSGDLRRDALGLAKKALDVFEKSFKSAQKPERREVVPLPPAVAAPVEIPVLPPPAVAPQKPAPAEQPPEVVVPVVAPFAKKPKPEAPPETEGPPQTEAKEE